MTKTANVTPCGAYRYALMREWDAGLPRLGVVMLNPSTADADRDDPTIRKAVGFARRLGYGSIEVVNLFGYRATDPRNLWARLHFLGYDAGAGYEEGDGDPVNEEAWRAMFGRCPSVLTAWGAHEWKGVVAGTVRIFRKEAEAAGARLFALAPTAGGEPRHPLYVPYSALDDVSPEHFAERGR